jgi:isoamylase
MFENIEVLPGTPAPLGCSVKGKGFNFSLYSAHAKKVLLGLGPHAEVEIPLHKTGDFWHICIQNLPPKTPYAYRTDLFNGWMLDPYGTVVETESQWNRAPMRDIRTLTGPPPPFDWQGVERPHIPPEDLIIYEMHVRGFARTYSQMIEKIPYLKKLGVNAVEFLPIYEFDEKHCKNRDPNTNTPLLNYWGYNPISYFAPKRSYSASGDPIQELKTLIRELHRNKIEVILDVVYNHTGEGSETDYAVCFRGLDPQTYYLAQDFTGCGNTFNSNHPQVTKLILASLHYFVREFQVDGFRFDLASSFFRDPQGKPIEKPPILEAIAHDPLFSKVKLIAEPWDAAGMYHVGHFPQFGPWSEWNGKYRDAVRKFLKGTDNTAHDFANALCGSDSLYKTPLSSINFITAHDGYSLRDLVTYQEKHNQANGENNADGTNQNDNWNCGAEGLTSDPAINELRERQIRNHLLTLFLSQGIPMLLMGDEYGHTRLGNNNPYTQDNELNWFHWDQTSSPILPFVQGLITFRQSHPALHPRDYKNHKKIAWHGQKPLQPNWASRFIAYTLDNLYIAFNAEHQTTPIELPKGPWHLVVNTQDPWDKHYFDKKGPALPQTLELIAHSALVCIR